MTVRTGPTHAFVSMPLTSVVLFVLVAAAAAVQPARRPPGGAARYEVRMEVRGQPVTTVTKTVTIREERGRLVVTETARMPAGDAIDEVELTRDALQTLKRSVTQGAMRMTAAFDAGRAKGSVVVGTTQKPFDVETGGAVYGDGPAAYAIFAALPLTAGYSVALRGFDMVEIKPKLKQALVVGAEDVQVPAGTFKAFRVRIEPERGIDQETLWIAVDTRRVVRATTTIPEAGAVIVAELAR